MTTQEVLKIVEQRGWTIKLVNGQPILTRPVKDETKPDALLAVLKRHRERIITALAAKEPT